MQRPPLQLLPTAGERRSRPARKVEQEHSESGLGGYNWAELKVKRLKHLEESDQALPFLCDESQTAGAEKLAEKYETSPTKVRQPEGNNLELLQYSQRTSSRGLNTVEKEG